MQGKDFNKAEMYLKEAYQTLSSPIAKGIAGNNLACVQWWKNLKVMHDL